MQRRDFLKSSVALTVAAEFGISKAQGLVSAHKLGKIRLWFWASRDRSP